MGEDKNILFNECLDRWLIEEAPQQMSRTDVEEARATAITDIRPYFADKTLRELTTEGIQAWLDKMARYGRSTRTLLVLHSIMLRVLEYGWKRGYAPTNATIGVDRPNYQRARVLVHVRDLGAAAQEELLNEVFTKDDPMRIPFVFLCSTELGLEEILALKWHHVCLCHHSVRTKHRLASNDKGSLSLLPVMERRTIRIGPTLSNTLENWKAAQAQQAIDEGNDYIRVYAPHGRNELVQATFTSAPPSAEPLPMVCTHPTGELVTLEYAKKRLAQASLWAF